jgi:hypothetical protein
MYAQNRQRERERQEEEALNRAIRLSLLNPLGVVNAAVRPNPFEAPASASASHAAHVAPRQPRPEPTQQELNREWDAMQDDPNDNDDTWGDLPQSGGFVVKNKQPRLITRQF